MILGILQARMSSSRLPHKVLKPILGEPMIIRQIERLMRAQLIDHFVVATSNQPADDVIAAECALRNISCFRGSLGNVLDRFYQAAHSYAPDYIVRLTADCPLADPVIIDAVIQYCVTNNYDYASNTLEPTFPDGLDVEVLRTQCLLDAWREAKLISQREHVTPFIHQQPQRYKLGSFKQKQDLSYLRWTVDEPEDFALIVKIYEALYQSNPAFNTQDILNYIEQNPELKLCNTHHQRNAGIMKSLQADKVYSENYNE